MTFSHYAGTAIIPTLARLVLAAAFVSTGWNKVFEKAEFTAEEATRLKQLGVEAEPVQPVARFFDADPGEPAGGARILLTSLQQDPTVSAPPVPTEPDPAEMPPTSPPAMPQDQDQDAATQPPPTTTAPLPAGTYRAAGMHHVTLLLEANNFPQPLWMARLAAFTELFGGAMLLIGLFSRLWGLGLTIAMGVAFYLVSMKVNGIFRMDPRDFALNIEHFNTAYCQAGLFVLAFGVFLTGAGPLSIDRILFGGPRHPNEVEVKID
jgi:uncharacterized membrane protein YphA (DoxX/SURF4 family)